ncbi:CIA30 family protein [Gracilimonas sp.]|uniref:CIA30 family protein n=1 Tax=Gracilimonas sp. TaxID=1974203 RepID=UPI002871D056|nr:CIA30 family protein [Gracilimonas sp.]
MKFLIGIILITLTMNSQTIVDLTTSSDLQNWRIVDDVVMGGRSSGNFELTAAGHGRYTGEISLKNNGGFSSLRYTFPRMNVSPDNHIRLRIKGDGKKYQFRVKNNRRIRHSYVYEFASSGKWETVNIPLQEMYPVFRGRNLELPDFDHNSIEELIILIGNKKPESFELLIDKIELLE